MGSSGKTTVDFGAFPGKTDATVTVTGETGILTGSCVAAWIEATATADHSIDEHWADPPIVKAGNIVAGTGFTIYAKARDPATSAPEFMQRVVTPKRNSGALNLYGNNNQAQNAPQTAPRCYGQWTVSWAWA